jgi:hypothetical protein
MLSVIMLSVIMLSVIMLSVIMLSVIMLSVIMLSVIVLSVIMQNVITLSVVAPLQLGSWLTETNTLAYCTICYQGRGWFSEHLGGTKATHLFD